MRSAIALVAFGLVMIAGAGSALAQSPSRAIAIEARPEVVAAPAVAPAPALVVEAPKEAPAAEAPVVEAPKEKVVVVPAPEKKILVAPPPVVIKKVHHYGYAPRGPICH